jgi:hypothetical protein
MASIRDFNPARSMLRNHLGYNLPSDVLLLEDTQSMQMKKYVLVR